MVQEVQTWVGITNETTLETIEAVGTSSFKIREWRQTTARYVNGCKATWNVQWSYSDGDSRDSGQIKSQDTVITEMSGKQEFTMYDGWIRIPVAWTYQITLYRGSWWSTVNGTIFLKAGNRVLYTKTFAALGSETVVINADLGKFDTIEIRGEFYYKGSSSGFYAFFSTQPELTIQQL